MVAIGSDPARLAPSRGRTRPPNAWTARHARTVKRLAALLASAALTLSLGAPTAAGASPVLPDIIEALPDHLQIQNDHQREYLRFSTVHINIGAGNLQIRGGGQIAPCTIDGIDYAQCTVATQEILDATGAVVATHPAGVAFFHPEHNHWHQSGVALFQIRTAANDPATAIAQGVKITFCFVDVETISTTGAQKKAYPRVYGECNGDLQGLAAHWADAYHQSTPLQELDITGVANGVYYLTHTADPENHWVESNEGNNFAWVKFKLSSDSKGNRKVTVLDHSPCEIPAQCGFGGNP